MVPFTFDTSGTADILAVSSKSAPIDFEFDMNSEGLTFATEDDTMMGSFLELSPLQQSFCKSRAGRNTKESSSGRKRCDGKDIAALKSNVSLASHA